MCPTCTHPRWGGVDQANQLHSYYYTGRQSRRWYQYVFWFLFNVCICNAHILESIHRGRQKRKQLQFRMALAKELIDGFLQRKRPSFSPGETQVCVVHKSVQCEGKKKQCVQCKKANCKLQRVTQLRHVLSANSVALHSARPRASWSIVSHDCSR